MDERVRLRAVERRGTGLVVATAVPAGTTLITVPASAVISGNHAKQILGLELDPEAALCVLLAEAREQAEAGQDVVGLREYLLELPADFPTLPLCLAEDEAELELQGTALLPAVAALRHRIEEERQEVLGLAAGRLEAIQHSERWLWAKAILQTRAGSSLQIIPDDEGSDAEAVIVPLIDFANWDANPSAECVTGPDGSLRLVTRRDLAAGSEVTMSYGEQSPEQLLFTFGFGQQGRLDVVMAPLPLDSHTSELRGRLLRFLALGDGNSGRVAAPLARLTWQAGASGHSPEVDVSELWAAANLHAMTEEELREVAKDVASSGELPRNLGQRVSPGAFQTLHGLLQAWSGELATPVTTGRRGRRFEAIRWYRSECRSLVEAALRRLEAEHLAAAPPGAGQQPA